jgi:hypothetical protein
MVVQVSAFNLCKLFLYATGDAQCIAKPAYDCVKLKA